MTLVVPAAHGDRLLGDAAVQGMTFRRGRPFLTATTADVGMPVRSIAASPTGRVPDVTDPRTPLVVVLPGLGMTRYIRRFALALARRSVTAIILDLPGFGSPGPRPIAPNIQAVGHAAARWVERTGIGSPLVLVGHSTGAQAAITAALDLQGCHRRLGLVLAGPTFAPAQRSWPGVLTRTPLAYRHDWPWQLDPRELWRAGPADLMALVRSGQRDRPEERLSALRVPLTVTAGHHDSYAPKPWLELLARSAVQAPQVRLVVLGGSHNNPWTHPQDLAEVTLEVATTC